MLLPPIGLFAALKFYKNGFVDVKAALYMALIFTLAASYSAEHSVDLNLNLLKIFAVFTIILGFYFFNILTNKLFIIYGTLFSNKPSWNPVLNL